MNILTLRAPRCCRERLSVDVNDKLQRQLMYQSTGSESALMITEGLLMYLPAATVEAVAAEAFNRSVIRHWISDITTSAFSRVLGGGAHTTASIRHVQAPDRLEGGQILETILCHGWTISSRRSYITDLGFVEERVRRIDGRHDTGSLPFPPGDPTGVSSLAHVCKRRGVKRIQRAAQSNCGFKSRTRRSDTTRPAIYRSALVARDTTGQARLNRNWAGLIVTVREPSVELHACAFGCMQSPAAE